jgi:hypothetical protein
VVFLIEIWKSDAICCKQVGYDLIYSKGGKEGLSTFRAVQQFSYFPDVISQDPKISLYNLNEPRIE